MRRGVLMVLGVCVAGVSFARAQTDHLECYKVGDALPATKYTADLAGLAVEPGCVVKLSLIHI